MNLSKHDGQVKLATEQRIAHLLSEAQRAMQQQQLLPQTDLAIKVKLSQLKYYSLKANNNDKRLDAFFAPNDVKFEI